MIACVYCYLLQVLSRFIYIIFSSDHRRLSSLKIHWCAIGIVWIVIFALPLPALLTNDIYFREGFLCWVPKRAMLHTIYIVIAYYTLPTVLIIVIYVIVNVRMHSTSNEASAIGRRTRRVRHLEIFRNIMISFSIYFLGGVPYMLFMITNVELLYTMGVISVTVAITTEKLCAIYIHREIRAAVKKTICQRRIQVMPLGRNVATIHG
ncbi:unnamed protein product [Adineta ricciae]|nr:unnamed protein product [Adineta ricciae]